MYRLKMSVLEEALLEFSQLLGLNLSPAQGVAPPPRAVLRKGTS
jgi:hypothetical protein